MILDVVYPKNGMLPHPPCYLPPKRHFESLRIAREVSEVSPSFGIMGDISINHSVWWMMNAAFSFLICLASMWHLTTKNHSMLKAPIQSSMSATNTTIFQWMAWFWNGPIGKNNVIHARLGTKSWILKKQKCHSSASFDNFIFNAAMIIWNNDILLSPPASPKM